MPRGKSVFAPPVRSMCAGHVISRIYNMGGVGKLGIRPGGINGVLANMELGALALMAEIALYGPDDQFIYHLRKNGLINEDKHIA